MDINSLITKKTSRDGELVACCPYCIIRHGSEDTKYHLGISLNKGVYHCFRCGASGSLNKEQLKYQTQKNPTLEDLKNRLNKVFEKKNSNFIDLDFISVKIDKVSTPIAYNYMLERGFTEQDLEHYKIRVGKEYEVNYRKVFKWVGRIIFPFFNSEGNCVYITGRSYTGKEPKYFNSEGDRSSLVFNLNSIQEEEPVILCEGIISSISAQKSTGVTSLALLGKSATWKQLNKIRSKTSKIYLCIDADTTQQEKKEIIIKLRKLRFEIYNINLPLLYNESGKKLKDPDDYKNQFFHFYKKAQRVIFI